MASSSPTTSIPIQEPVFLQFFMMFTMLIFYYIEQWPYFHLLSSPTLNPHLFPALTYGTNLTGSDRTTRTRPMPLLTQSTSRHPTSLRKKPLWMSCWKPISLNHINMLLPRHLKPFLNHLSSQLQHHHIRNANRRPKQFPKYLRSVVAFMNIRDPAPRAHFRHGPSKKNKNFVHWRLMRNPDFHGGWSRPRWPNLKMTFDLCGTRSKTHLADHLWREIRKRTSCGNVLPLSIPNFVCLSCSCGKGIAYFLTTFSPLSHPFWHGWSTWTFKLHYIHTVSLLLCLYASTWTDIVSSELWPTTASLLPDDHALRPGHLLPPRVLHLSSTHPAGHLRLLHPIDRSFYNWTWNLCSNWQPETRITISWPPRSRATSPPKHMTACSRPSRWSTPTMPAVISFQTWKQWWRIRSYRDGRYTYKRRTSTWWSTRIKELRCLMTFLILSSTSWTGFTRHGRLINISMPSHHVTVHLCCWHPIQIRKIRALRSMFKWFLEGIHSSLQHDIRRLPRDRPLEILPWHAHIYKKEKEKRTDHEIFRHPADHLYYQSLLFDSLCSQGFPTLSLHIVVVFLNLDLLWRNFGFSLFRSHIYCFRTWRTPRLMTFFGCFQPVPQLRQSMALIRISHLMILPQHRTFPGQPEWLQPLRPFTPYLSRS